MDDEKPKCLQSTLCSEQDFRQWLTAVSIAFLLLLFI